jgi:hypothetical protein
MRWHGDGEGVLNGRGEKSPKHSWRRPEWLAGALFIATRLANGC